MNNSGNNVMEKEVVIFLHIPKTAGTTLRYIIQYQYKPPAIYELYGPSATHSQRLEKLQRLSEAKKAEIKIVNAHLGFGLHEFLPQPCTYITFLRNPVERVVSMYYYFQRTGNNYVQNLTLKDFIQTYGGARDNMTKYLSGEKLKIQLTDPNNEINYQCSTESLEIAKSNLKKHFKVIGLAERFDESLILLKKRLGWQLPLYDKNNVSKKRPSTKEVSKDTLNLIEKFNEFDIQLYEYAKELFEELINQQGSSFKREIEKFKETNESSKVKIYFRAHTFYNRVIHRTYKELVKR
jgi:hypothetical protein